MIVSKNNSTSSDVLQVIHPSSKFNFRQQDRLVLPLQGTFEIIKFEDIIYCSADSNYVTVHDNSGRKITLAKTLKWVEHQLNNTFFRPHQSYLVNLKMVKRYDFQEGLLELAGGAQVSVSRSMKKELIQYFKV